MGAMKDAGLVHRSKLRYCHEDEFQTIRVIDVFPQRHRLLQFEESIQGALSLDAPSDPALEYVGLMGASAMALSPSRKRVLLAGLGSCALYHFMQDRIRSDAILEAVEENPVVVDLAYRFFRFPKQAKVTIADIRQHLDDRPAIGIDLFYMDCYGAHGIPPHLTTAQFIDRVKQHLSPQGTVVFNIWNERCSALSGSQIKTILNCFGQVAILACKKDENLVAVARPAGFDNLPQAIALKQETYSVDLLNRLDDFNWPAFVRRGRVLTDKNLSHAMRSIAVVCDPETPHDEDRLETSAPA